jgi:uncharacterized protein (DUF885 family)
MTSATSPLAADAVRGVTDPALRALVAEHWEWLLRWSPTYATTLGDHRFDDRLAPRDQFSLLRYNGELTQLLTRIASLDAGKLEGADLATWMLLITGLQAAGVFARVGWYEWAVSSRGGLLDEISYLVELHPLGAPADGDHLLARLRAGVAWVDDTIANLRRGAASGRFAAREPVRRAIAQLDAQLAQPTEAWALCAPARPDEPRLAAWPADARDRFAAALRDVVDGALRPAFGRYRDFLAAEILPHGRTGADEGMHALPDGAALYRAFIDAHVGGGQSAEELHALGLAEIARTDQAIAALGASLFGAADLAATVAHLRRTDDRALYFGDRDALLAAAETALARAKAALPRWFGRVPRADCVVREMPAHEAPYTTIAYYREPHYDGSKPGEYFVNTYRPEVRPRFELEALTFHESIPGHHLQIAIAQELDDLPLFRKLGGSTAYVEGWALYTERLADEMGLYSSELDRLGMHSYDAWRASRLVVDTGLHAMGWTRAEAEAYMLAHTALTPENISNEVDRYITDPGQALAYKVGQLKMFEMRDLMQRAMRDRFDLRTFHDVILGAGAVTLPVLHLIVGQWIVAQTR